MSAGARRKPWGKWYWGDWRKDVNLRTCSFAARGLWADMLSLMGEAEPFGFLLLAGGKQPTPTQLQSLLGGSSREIARLLRELEQAKIFSKSGGSAHSRELLELISPDVPQGTIFSRRMLRDEARAKQSADFGREGGNPALIKGRKGRDKPPHISARARGRAFQRLEARKEESPLPPKGGRASEGDFDEWWSAYPRREGKGQAEPAYRKALKIATPEELLFRASRYAELVRDREPRFIRLPATWLNGKGWLDERRPSSTVASQPGNGADADPDGIDHFKENGAARDPYAIEWQRWKAKGRWFSPDGVKHEDREPTAKDFEKPRAR